jgi:hypothetical protein
MMDVQNMVQDELNRAMQKFPTWPTDPLHALAVLGEDHYEGSAQHTQEIPQRIMGDDPRRRDD